MGGMLWFQQREKRIQNDENIYKKTASRAIDRYGLSMVILIGTQPVADAPGLCVRVLRVKPVDALFSATSAVCVTGLVTIDTADHFTAFGQAIMGLLIQIGGLGVSSVGVGLVIAAGKRSASRVVLWPRKH